ncbi:hypothetical protein N657DRAFT_373070 [Parathielavia appendiculata]|uniref:Uncharacterized protein n=1 Tax=Parathielavia appendiculata TaxID=2587402 RepID=A0AAN6TPS1_9PEZI|nr:hypothetical protein N657DRAFT_373070 [Parathielavia appendiculata]
MHALPFPVKEHPGPPAQAAGHRKTWKTGPCDLVFHFQGVAAPRSYCAACWWPKTSISRIRSEVSERPEIPHHPARQPRLTDTNDKNKLQQTLQNQGDTGYENHPTLSTF